jgi:TolB protein
MRKIETIFTLSMLIGLMIACTGSRKGDETVVHFDNEQVQAQVEDLRDKIKDNPNNIEFRTQLATIYHENGENLEAMRVLEDGFAIDPSNAEAKYLYAEIAMTVGDQRKAYQAYKDVLQSVNGAEYLDRIGPKFTDAFKVTKLIGSTANEAFGRYSKDGSKIIYQSDQTGNWDIFEYVVADGSIKQLTNTPQHEENPDFSPDGKMMVYASTLEDHRDVDYDQKLRDIFVYDFENNRETNLTTNGSNDWRPSYSNDGKYITFVSERSDLRDVPFYQLYSDIFIMEKDGRFQLQLTKTDGHNGGPSIAPHSTDESGIVYFDSDKTGAYEIYRTDFKGNDTRQITFNPGSNDVSPCVSSSGDKIVFFSDRDGNYEIYMMNTDGSAAQRLTANPADDLNPVFSPDGAKVLFHSNRDGSYDIFQIDLSEQSGTLGIYDVISRIDTALNNLQ